MQEAAVKEFFNAWSTYNAVLDQNYMAHAEIYRDVQNLLTERYSQQPLDILDLGCGSARHLAPALAGCSVKRYRGYDLSTTALAEAARNLVGLTDCLELRQGDLLTGLKASETVDLIVCSFVLHHFSIEDKADFFQAAHDHLNGGGMLLLIDVVRDPDEDLPLYLDRYCQMMQSQWSALSKQTIDALCEHVQNHDFPETLSVLQTTATEVGFAQCIELSHFGWHRSCCWSKA